MSHRVSTSTREGNDAEARGQRHGLLVDGEGDEAGAQGHAQRVARGFEGEHAAPARRPGRQVDEGHALGALAARHLDAIDGRPAHVVVHPGRLGPGDVRREGERETEREGPNAAASALPQAPACHSAKIAA